MPARLLIGSVLVLILVLERNQAPRAQPSSRPARSIASIPSEFQARMEQDETQFIRQSIHSLEKLARALKQNAEGERQ